METITKQEENEKLMRTVSKNIRKYRKLRHMTQEVLADKLDISREYIRRFETNEGKEGLTFLNIYKISLILDVKLDDLVKNN